MKRFWDMLYLYTLEKSCIWTTLVWGVSITILQPISANSPLLRGMFLMNEVFAWTSIPSDYFWGLATSIPAIVQLFCLNDNSHPRLRAICSIHCAAIFMFVAILIGRANWKSTGIAMYAGIAFAQLAIYSQLTHARYRDEAK